MPFIMKDFNGQYGLHCVEYWKCVNCGFVLSKTHMDMTDSEWNDLNKRVHESYQGSDYAEEDPNWLSRLNAQAKVLAKLADKGILPVETPWVDYACGDGKLVDILEEKGICVYKYDRYMHGNKVGYLSHGDLISRKYGNVINTSAFEHFLTIEPVDEIMNIIDKNGVLSLHTLVREMIPEDPSWFYLLSVHVAFYTNRAMELLFDRYSFFSSLYHLESRMWFWFKSEAEEMKSAINSLIEGDPENFFYKKGFMDYWK